MKKKEELIEKFIEKNWDNFSNLEDSEVAEYSINEIDNELVQVLKEMKTPYQYKNIMVYYENFFNEMVCVELV
jgi:hypothetical protein